MDPDENPYRPPPPEVDAPPATIAAGGRPVALYTTGQVVLATFLGTPLAGTIIMALNYRRLGQPRAGATVLLGVVATALITAVSFVLPRGVPALLLNVLTLVGMHRLCNSLQGRVVSEHLAEGGERGSTWAAVGVGLGCAAAVLMLVLGGYVLAEEAFSGAGLRE